MRIDPTFFQASDAAAKSKTPEQTQRSRSPTSFGDRGFASNGGNHQHGEARVSTFIPATREQKLPGRFREENARGQHKTVNFQSGSSEPFRTAAPVQFRIRRTKSADDAGVPVEIPQQLREGGRRRRPTRSASSVARVASTGDSSSPLGFVRLSSRRQPEPEKPWGLSREDMETVGSFVEPEQTGFMNKPMNNASKQESENGTASHTKTSPTSKSSTALTHLTSSGEAHMVDVGAKQATRRVAIATARVKFSSEEPLRLIAGNSNKKGDVLSVARIAGIMAAKRTSDMIPLCHPISISKVEVDIEWSKNAQSQLSINSLVECVGPTGVEMEALTATMGAALTVYDMCKAVDKHMMIDGARVAYKSGGRTGTYGHHGWARERGSEYFKARGLEWPRL